MNLKILTNAINVFLLLMPMLAVGQQQDKPPLYSPPGKLVDVGGYRLHLNCSGRIEPTVVLIAGAGDFSFDWGLVQPKLSVIARVCSYDRAGFAWSDPGPTPRTMKQEAYELHTLLRAAEIKPPYVLVGHSIGGLIARVYAGQFPSEVAGMVLIDPTHEDTTLMYQGKLVRIRDGAKGTPVPDVQTMKTSPPKPPTANDIEQFAFNQKMFGAPKTEPPFDKLTEFTQKVRLSFQSQPPRAAAGPDYWAEELQAMYMSRAKTPYQLGDKPLVVIIPKPDSGNPPPGISVDEWKRVSEEKRQQKLGLVNLSKNSRLLIANSSGHHIQLDEPDFVTDVVFLVVDAIRRRSKLAPQP
ncbi:MAG: alpha/beta hydrolase [Pyrinomonadaceae bacterium]|nr:alpha/beta hydrolase [Pyrinomonadaceae bacterium]